jgi:hypothetical protein
MNVDKDIEGIQNQINNIIGANTKIVRRKKNNDDIKHELFINIITQIELVLNRSTLVHSDFKIDLSDYDEMYLQIIDNLIYLSFGTQAAELIIHYCYDRLEMDGSIPYVDTDGNEREISDPEQLWQVVKKLL